MGDEGAVKQIISWEMILSKQVLSVVSRPARLSSHVSRLHSQLCGIERFVGGLKSAGAGFFIGMLVKVLCGYHCTDGGCPFSP